MVELNWRKRQAALAARLEREERRRVARVKAVAERARIQIEICTLVVASVAALIATVTAAYSAYQARVAGWQFRLAQQQTIATSMPWIGVVWRRADLEFADRTMRFDIKNAGQTPAYNFRIATQVMVVDPRVDRIYRSANRRIEIGTILPGEVSEPLQFHFDQIIDSKKTELVRGSHIVVASRYRYDTIFNTERRGSLCDELTLSPDLRRIVETANCRYAPLVARP